MSEYIYRRNAVTEALRSERRTVHKLWLQQGLPKKEAAPFLQMAGRRGVKVETVDKHRLGNLAHDGGHQGVVLEVAAYRYAALDEMFDRAAAADEPPLLLILDLIQGPHNVGMLLRSAEAAGVHGVIVQQRRAPDITPSVVAASAGASEHLLIAQEVNLNRTLEQLKQRDVWVAGADMSGDRYDQVDLNRALALVIGHEGSGLRQSVRQNCDLLLRIPMHGKVESLNAAVSGSILLYAARLGRS